MKTTIIQLILGLAFSGHLLAGDSFSDIVNPTPYLVFQESITTTTTLKNPTASKPTTVTKQTETSYFIPYGTSSRMVFKLYPVDGVKSYSITGKTAANDYEYGLDETPWTMNDLTLTPGKVIEFLTLNNEGQSMALGGIPTNTSTLTLLQGTRANYRLRNPEVAYSTVPSYKGSGLFSQWLDNARDNGGTKTGTIKHTVSLVPKLVQQFHSSAALPATGTRPAAAQHTLRQAAYLLQAVIESKGYTFDEPAA
jgi:hypothetical protein